MRLSAPVAADDTRDISQAQFCCGLAIPGSLSRNPIHWVNRATHCPRGQSKLAKDGSYESDILSFFRGSPERLLSKRRCRATISEKDCVPEQPPSLLAPFRDRGMVPRTPKRSPYEDPNDLRQAKSASYSWKSLMCLHLSILHRMPVCQPIPRSTSNEKSVRR
jgi:hypothetical protein